MKNHENRDMVSDVIPREMVVWRLQTGRGAGGGYPGEVYGVAACCPEERRGRGRTSGPGTGSYPHRIANFGMGAPT